MADDEGRTLSIAVTHGSLERVVLHAFAALLAFALAGGPLVLATAQAQAHGDSTRPLDAAQTDGKPSAQRAGPASSTVQIDVTVTDQNGLAVIDLQSSDFELRD